MLCLAYKNRGGAYKKPRERQHFLLMFDFTAALNAARERPPQFLARGKQAPKFW
jgi:hypothetical protein